MDTTKVTGERAATRDAGLTQRGLVGRRLALEDGELVTRYVFPFIDPAWSARLTVVDAFGGPPRVFSAPVTLAEDRLTARARVADLHPVESVPLDVLQGLVHLDPWWVFRGVSGVDRIWIEAIVAANVARPFVHMGVRYRVHDLAFGAETNALETVLAKDDSFRVRAFRKGDIDLAALRRPPTASGSSRRSDTKDSAARTFTKTL